MENTGEFQVVLYFSVNTLLNCNCGRMAWNFTQGFKERKSTLERRNSYLKLAQAALEFCYHFL